MKPWCRYPVNRNIRREGCAFERFGQSLSLAPRLASWLPVIVASPAPIALLGVTVGDLDFATNNKTRLRNRLANEGFGLICFLRARCPRRHREEGVREADRELG
jgi:hypothetical protein